MNLMRAVTLLLALAAGCAHERELSRQEQLAETTRTFPASEKEAVIEAARRVIQAGGGGRLIVADNIDGFVATRTGLAVFLDTWTFTVRERGAELVASVSVFRNEQSLMLLPTTTPGTFAAGTSPTSSVPIAGSALYRLFWQRVEYALHRSNSWPTCAESRRLIEAGAVGGRTDALCPEAPPSVHPSQAWPTPPEQPVDRVRR